MPWQINVDDPETAPTAAPRPPKQRSRACPAVNQDDGSPRTVIAIDKRPTVRQSDRVRHPPTLPKTTPKPATAPLSGPYRAEP